MTSPGKTSINYDEWYAMKKEFDESKPESTLAKERKSILREVERAKKTPATWNKYVETHPITPEYEDPEISGTWRTVNKTNPIPIPFRKRKGGRKIRKISKSRKSKKISKSRKTRKTRKSKKISKSRKTRKYNN